MEELNNIQKILDALQDIIMIVDRDFHILIANRRLVEAAEMRMEDIIGKHCYEISHNRLTACISDCPLQNVFERGTYHKVNHFHVSWDGTERYEEISFTPITDENGKVTQVFEVIRDLTENKKIEKQLIHSEKLACMGEIAANLAHEINNPLGIITGFVQHILEDKLKEGNEIFEEMKIVEHECLRCSRIVRDLLNFARPSYLQKSTCDIRDVILTAVQILDYKLKRHNIRLEENLGEIPTYVEIDIPQFQQVLINIILNAIQAMSLGGKLSIEINTNAGPMENEIELIIQDEGSGIPPAHLDKIFDPFFSTKAKEGIGLGLSLSRRIIKAHGGRICAKSEINKGTKMIIHLPMIENSPFLIEKEYSKQMETRCLGPKNFDCR